MTNQTPIWWVVTDLDGTLMDHRRLVAGGVDDSMVAIAWSPRDSLHQQDS